MMQGEDWSPTVIQPNGAGSNAVLTGGGAVASAPKKSGFKKWAILAAFILLFGGAGSYFLFASHAGTAYVNGKIWTGYYTMSPVGTDLAYTYLPTNAEAQSTVMSPDGTQIAYQTLRTTDTVQLGIEKVNETNPANAKIVGNLPSDTANIEMQWSQNGNWLATNYSQIGKNGYDSYVYLVHPDGTGGYTVPNLNTYQFAWMPDSQHLIYTGTDGLSLCVIAIDGTGNACHAIQNTAGATVSGNFRANYVAASQDGTKAAVISYDNQTDATMGPSSNVYTLNLDGTGLKKVTNFPQPAQLQKIIWSPDGQKIAFMLNPAGGNIPGGVYTMNIDGSNQTRINDSMYIPSLSWQYVPAGSDSNPPPVLPGDTTPPTVAIASPADGAAITSSLPITVTANDNVGVTKVELYADGKLQGTDSTSPYTFTLAASVLSSAQKHTIVARAYDAASNSSVSPAVTLNKAYAYNALTSARIDDTRAGSGLPDAGKTMGAGSVLKVKVAGLGGVPATAKAAILNVIAVAPTTSTYLTVYPGSLPHVSNVNAPAGRSSNAQVTTALAADGTVNIYNAVGNTNVIVEVEGYFSDSGTGYNPVNPTRISDTRATSTYQNKGQTLKAGGTETVQVTGKAGVPAGATSAVVKVTALNATATSYFTLYPAGASRPLGAQVSFNAGTTLTKEVTVKLGSNPAGAFTIYNVAGTADAIVDVVGYFGPTGSMFVPVTPTRIADTRSGSNLPFSGVHLSTGGSIGLSPHFEDADVSTAAVAAVTNLTVLNATATTYLSAYPSGLSYSGLAAVSTVKGLAMGNEATVGLGANGREFTIRNAAGTADVIVDLFGYYSQ